MNIGVVGLGLIGGSMAKSIKKRTQHTVYGCDINAETFTMCRMSGAVDGELTDSRIPDCDIILLAISPKATISWAKSKAELISKGAILTDLCGVKRAICSELSPLARKYGFRYIGGHPMAGKECSGFRNADAGLFLGASMILTPDADTDMQMLEKLKQLFLDAGFGTLTFSDPDEHDRIIALTSQLAHITSSAYVKAPAAQRQRGFSAGSFRDMTRVARLDENMWTQLFSANRDYLTAELETLIDNLNDYLSVLKSGDNEALCALLKDGREKKETAGGR